MIFVKNMNVIPKSKSEAFVPADIVNLIIQNSGTNSILVGGQALAFWAKKYEIVSQDEGGLLTRDVDILAPNASDVFLMNSCARLLNGLKVYPSKHALTALIGQIVKNVSDSEYWNVDILHKLLFATDGVRKRSVNVSGIPCKIMHPLDVLSSRLINLHKLPDKQNASGQLQLVVAIAIARSFLKEQYTASENMRPFMHSIVGLVKSDAGRKIVDRHNIHVADSLIPEAFDINDNFLDHHLKFLLNSMSNDYRNVFEDQVNFMVQTGNNHDFEHSKY